MPASRRLLSLSLGASLVVSATLVGAGPAFAAKQPPVTVLVTNDKVAAAPSIDTLVRALRKVAGVKVTFVAPATEQASKADLTTPGTLQAIGMTTGACRRPASPADTVNYALNTLKLKPNV